MATIIVADDSTVAQASYAVMLRVLGYNVLLAANGADAVRLLREKSPDLVILDINMPVMNGFDACREMRKLPEGLNIPIIIVSVEDSEENIMKGIDAGANDYLIKPVKEAHLIAKLKTFLKFSAVHKRDIDMVKNRAEIANRYAIERLLDYGEHSVVFLAEDKQNNINVAIKLINTPEIDNFSKIFTETASKIKAVSSQFILKIFDYGQLGERFYIVVEYAGHGNLANVLKRRKLQEDEAVKLAVSIIRALKALSAENIVHFDIKPENIMLVGSDYKLGDFGIITPRESATVPLRMEIWSAVPYLSPEYLNGCSSIDCKSDIYSLGITLYEAATGDNPFRSNKPAVSMFRQINLSPPPLRNLGLGVSSRFSDAVRIMMEKNPSDRPGIDELEHLFTHIHETPESIPGGVKQDKKIQRWLKDEVNKPVQKARHYAFEFWKLKRQREILKLRLLKFGIAKIVLFGSLILVFSLAYGYFAFKQTRQNVTTPKQEQDDLPEKTLVSVICLKCGKGIEIRTRNIGEEKCGFCGGKLAYWKKCNNCGSKFPYTKPAVQANVPQAEDLPVKCPKCNSENTTPAPAPVMMTAPP